MTGYVMTSSGGVTRSARNTSDGLIRIELTTRVEMYCIGGEEHMILGHKDKRQSFSQSRMKNVRSLTVSVGGS